MVEDEILDAAIAYKFDGTYPSEALKDKKRVIQKRAERLEIDKGELFFLNGQKVKIITDPAEQKRILEACHSVLLGILLTGFFWINLSGRKCFAQAISHRLI